MTTASVLLLTASLALLVPTSSHAENQPGFNKKLKIEQHKNWLAVLNANEGKLTPTQTENEYRLTLTHFNDHTILFTDRPYRETRLITTNAFITHFKQAFSDSSQCSARL
ncbi:hypothetical protein [uncultured Shewanella sp.]|uniref:hypothetical protein n=1 Tax=uncultured Shewanella sp. TaxID=173975 RepID=UPI0026337F0E|nr:hypothetical protein [uncultured Shewanella sp.]